MRDVLDSLLEFALDENVPWDLRFANAHSYACLTGGSTYAHDMMLLSELRRAMEQPDDAPRNTCRK